MSLSREAVKALYVTELLRENLETVLTVLVVAGERDLAGQLASRCGATLHIEVGSSTAQAELRARGINAGLGRAAAELRARTRAELERRRISTDSHEAFADAVARMARERDQ